MLRRDFLKSTSVGLAVTAAGGLRLRADVEPTPVDGALHEQESHLGVAPRASAERGLSTQEPVPTPTDDLGPFYREGSIYRGKVTPPLERGSPLVVTGRVWGFDTGRPLGGSLLDVWHADVEGDYEGSDGDVRLRIRVVADEDGYYEFETVYPGHYQGRPAHIHYIVRSPGYAELTTQLYFRGDVNNDNERDRLAERPTQITDLETVTVGADRFRRGVFDIVLRPTP